MTRVLFLLVVAVALGPRAQERLPSPGEFLGHALGARFTPHARLDAYVRLAARLSDRVTIEDYGHTYEGRPLTLLTVTAAANHARLPAIREALAEIADPRRLGEGEKVDGLIETTPVVLWLSYNVHGNEPSPSEAMLEVLHRLVTADDAETTSWLEGAICIIDPCLNPDGRDRYVNWLNGVMGPEPDPDPQSMEHREPWPGGRYNHDLFDLNRDWAFATQPETRARLPRFVAWSPQVHVDFHEMGYESTYFFFPAEKPVNANLNEHTMKWGKIFGEGNAKAFDERGWSYYTAESFDLFYPGYGDSWPSFTGAIGMTYEQGGHSRAGVAVHRRDGTLLTLEDRLRHHAEASYATIRTAVGRRAELLGDYHRFRKGAIEEGRTGSLRAVLLPAGRDPGRVAALVSTLLVQGIEVHRLVEPVTLARVSDSRGAAVLDRSFESGTYVVRLDQPMKRLAKTLLEPRTEIKELYFYDISAWSLPLAYGTPAYGSPVAVPGAMQRVTEAPRPRGGAPEKARVAWLLPYDTRGALEAAIAALRAGLQLRSARKEFTLEDRRFGRGTIVIRRSENPEATGRILDRIGRETGARFVAADSGFTEKGIDLGSRSVARIVPPRIALVGGEGVSATSFGATRYLMTRLLGVPHSVVPLRGLATLRTARYTAIVIPEGRVPSAARTNLERFVTDGGVVVALGRAAFSLLGGKDGVVRIRDGRGKAGEAAKEKKPGKWIEDRDAHRRERQQPGSIFRVELDPAHPLSFGYRSEIFAFKAGTRSFDPDGPGLHVARFVEADPVSGYVNEADAKALAGRSFASVERRGRGAFVLFADDTNFRGAWQGLSRLFVNAALLLPDREIPPITRRR